MQLVGSVGEVILFFSGFYLGKGMILTAGILTIIRIIYKIVMEEFKHSRNRAVIGEGVSKLHADND